MTIKELRKQLKMTQSEFARHFDIPIANVQHWEQGVSSPPSYVLNLLLRVSDLEFKNIGFTDSTEYVKPYKIGNAADYLGVKVDTLRRYHKKGILIPFYVSPSGIRYYTKVQLDEYLDEHSKCSNQKVDNR